MSKYSILKGLVKEILPTGEKVLVHEGDDILRALHGLDERMIESGVSQRDAFNRANAIKKELANKLYPRKEFESLAERRPLTRELSSKLDVFNDSPGLPKLLDRIDSPRTVGTYHFPEEFDKYVDPEEIAQLSKQYNDNFIDLGKALDEKRSIMRQLEKVNPDSIYLKNQIDLDAGNYPEIIDKRFKNIKAALKAMENK